jgi:hypothetical protein
LRPVLFLFKKCPKTTDLLRTTIVSLHNATSFLT